MEFSLGTSAQWGLSYAQIPGPSRYARHNSLLFALKLALVSVSSLHSPVRPGSSQLIPDDLNQLGISSTKSGSSSLPRTPPVSEFSKVRVGPWHHGERVSCSWVSPPMPVLPQSPPLHSILGGLPLHVPVVASLSPGPTPLPAPAPSLSHG